MTKINLKLILCFSMLLSFQFLSAQYLDESFQTGAELNRSIQMPMTPEASAFEQYGNTQVDLYYGKPSVQVPIYVHKGRELDLPISLTYDASGVKVEQTASNVGLSWNLNVGGRITRIVNGLPDDYETATGSTGLGTTVPYKTIWNDNVNSMVLSYGAENQLFDTKQDAEDYLYFLKGVNENEYDPQPDYFSMNALGLSETFVIDIATRQPKALNNPRITVDCHKSGNTSSQNPLSIPRWTVIGDDGTRYYFEEQEISRSESDYDNSPVNFALRKKYVSSWYLTKVISANNKDTYEFYYGAHENYTKPVTTLITRVQNAVNTSDPNDISYSAPIGNGTVTSYYSTKPLETIKHNGKVIVENTNGPRFDLTTSRVDEIVIYKDYATNEKYKSFNLNYSYFKTSSGLTVNSSTNKAKIRLKLDSVDIRDSQGSVENSYSFEYESPFAMPELNSLSQDYYGYYNGAGNTVLYPETNAYNELPPNDGADRSVDFSKGKRGLLKKITYPTGGYSLFTFGPNRSNYTTPSETTTEIVFESYAYISLAGGLVCPPSNPWNCTASQSGSEYWDLFGGIGAIKYNHGIFEIPENGNYLINAGRSGATFNHTGKQIILFKRDDLSTCSGTPLRFDEIISPSGGAVSGLTYEFLNNSSGNVIFNEEPIFLEAGCYQVMIADNDEGSTTYFNIGRYVLETGTTGGETQEVDKAGFRINKIQNYTDGGVLATEKVYDYDVGNVISQPLYRYVTTEYHVNNYGIAEPSEILYRQSYVSGTDRPHIGYDSVKEILVNYNDSDLNRNTNYTFYSTNWASHSTGVHNYYIDGKQTANSYSNTYKLGKPEKVSTEGYKEGNGSPFDPPSFGTKYITESEYQEKQFYQNIGVYGAIRETNGYYFPIPTETPSNRWFIDLRPGNRIASLSSVFHGGDGIIRLVPPLDCGPSEICKPGIARQELRLAVARGKVGAIKQKIEVEKVSTPPGESENKIVKTTDYFYYDDPALTPYNFLPKEVSATNSKGKIQKNEIFYPENNPSEYVTLINKNMVKIPVATKYFEGDVSNLELLSHKKTLFNGAFPSEVQVAKGNHPLEARVHFDRYINGNLAQTSMPNGTQTSYIWGYDKQYIIAKIENVASTEIDSLLGIGFSPPEGLSTSQEAQLRAIPNAMVTTFTYEPMIGLTSMTDPRGYTTTYEYDEFHRLERVRDADNNILQETDYNFRDN